MDDRISEVIQQVMEETTFTPVALKRFQEIADLADERESLIAELRAENLSLENLNQKRRKKEMALEKKLEGFDERERALVEREKQITALEKNAAVADAKSQTWREACGLIFRNAEVRKSMSGGGNIPDPNGTYSGATIYTDRNSTTTEEEV